MATQEFVGVDVLGGIRPCIIGLILATAITMFMSAAIEFGSIGDTLAIDFKGIIIFAILISIVAKLTFKKKPTPILMIIISAGLGMLMYSL